MLPPDAPPASSLAPIRNAYARRCHDRRQQTAPTVGCHVRAGVIDENVLRIVLLSSLFIIIL